MRRNIIRITESDLRRMVMESVALLRERTYPEEEAQAMEYDRRAYMENVEDECSVCYAFFPDSMTIKKEYDLDDADGEDYILVVITPQLRQCDEYSMDIDDLDYIFDFGNDHAAAEEAESQYGDFINKWIDSNYDAICDYIVERSNYSIN